MKSLVSCLCLLMLATLFIFSASVLRPTTAQAESSTKTCNDGHRAEDRLRHRHL